MSLTLVSPPVEHPAVARARLHRNLSALVERLISFLDDLDADPDLEPDGGDEPGLGWPSNHLIDQTYWVALASSDDDREADDEDDEPSLCGVTFGGGSRHDLEHQCEDEGAVTGDDEPETAH